MKRFGSLFIILALLFNLSSCVISIPDVLDALEEVAGVKEEPDEWVSASSIDSGVAVTVVKGESVDLCAALEDKINTEGAAFASHCEAVVSLDGGVATGNKYGRTTVTVTDTEGQTLDVTVTVEFLLSKKSDFDVNGRWDNTHHKVSTVWEADRLLDEAISNRKSKLAIDFSGIDGFDPFEDYVPDIELGSSVSLRKIKYAGSNTELTIEIDYRSDTASTYTEAERTYRSVTNGNMLARLYQRSSSEYARTDDFDDFAIYTSNRGTREVYNSEELWYALEKGYLPTFPRAGTKAELFFERAKMILRDIITEDMNDYDKILAIYDYLIDSVAYDYAAADAPETRDSYKNVCYYLEGVFERGRAVCDGKAKAFVLFCAIEGIECLRDTGRSKDGGAGHAWNYVNLDGVWYLIDTTDADVVQGSGSDMADFFGYELEINSYSKFLTKTSACRDEYEYSNVFSNIPLDNTRERALESFDRDIYGTGYDFFIDSADELAGIFRILVSGGGSRHLQLTVRLNSTLDVYNTVNVARNKAGIRFDYSVYQAKLYTVDICYLMIKLK